MYEQVFHFNSRPFTSTPFVKHYFAADAIDQALGQTKSCIERGAGPAIVVGGAGTGKTLLLAMLEEHYQSQFNVVNLGCARLDERSELLQSILFELQLPYKGLSETELRFSLMDFLKPNERCPNGMLLLVDEAHSLSAGLIDEVRLITNFVRDGEPRVRLVMAGSQRLEETLNDPKLESFNQRIAARCFLQKMSRDETANYVVEHIDRAGGAGTRLFTPESLKAVHEVSDGCPRLINLVCDQALILTATRGEVEISENGVHEAWAEVQSIPGSFTPSSSHSASDSDLQNDENWTVIEFGQLDDSEEEPNHDSEAESLSCAGGTVEPSVDSEMLDQVELAEERSDELEDSGNELMSVGQRLGEFVETGETIDEETELDESVNAEESLDLDSLASETDESATTIDHDINPATVEMVDGPVEQIEPELEQSLENDSVSELDGIVSDAELDVDQDSEPIAQSESDLELQGQLEISQPTEALSEDIEDPFAESFVDEEDLVDRYAPFVAHQNQSSLTVTSDELAMLRPIEGQDGSGALVLNDGASLEVEQEPEPEELSEASSEPADEADFAVDATDDVVSELDTNLGSDDTKLDSDDSKLDSDDSKLDSDDSNQGALEEEKILYSNEQDPCEDDVEEAKYHDHLSDSSSTDVQREAEKILQRLGVSHETPEPEETPAAEAESEVTSIPMVVSSVSESTENSVADEDADFEKQNAALDETQQILNEILEQKNLLAEQRVKLKAEDDQASDAETPVQPTPEIGLHADSEIPTDDREMIIVNRMEEQSEPESPAEESIPFPTTPVSTGRAERMDYQKLFEQLRDAANPDD